MSDSLLKWGICSAGNISNDIAICLNMIPKDQQMMIAVAARSLERAEKFAEEHSIPKFYGSYQELADDPEINVVYIGSIHTEHYSLSKMMLEAGKHVLCEKPLCVTLKETQSLVEIAKKEKRFLMEGIWSRCFPVYKKLRELLDSGAIGEVQHVQCQFGEYSKTLVPRIREKELAGGAILDRGVYPVQFAQFVFNEKPVEIKAFGTLLKETGVDTSCHVFLRYSNNRTAVVGTSILSCLNNEGIVSGTNGKIKVCFPFWCPSKLEVSVNTGFRDVVQPEDHIFPLPFKGAQGQMIFRNSEGFVFELMEVRNAIMKGQLECPLHTHQMSLDVAEVLESARLQIGYDLPQDSATY